MDKLSLNPSKVRGYGNVLEEKSETDASLLYSHLSSIGRDNVGGIQSKVFVMEYINNDLYFSDYPLLCIKGEDYSFEVTSTGSGDVTLYDGSTSLGTETISGGVATFTDISFSTTGIHTLYATKSSIKSGNIVVNVVDINSISGDFMMAAGVNSTHPHSTTAYIDAQLLRFQILDPNNQPVANVPVSITIGTASPVSLISDSDGFVSVDYTGHGSGDIGVTVVCGNVSANFTLHDVEFGIYDGKYWGSYNGFASASRTNYDALANLTMNEQGFTITPYSDVGGSSASSWLVGKFEDVVVDFTYLSNVGHFPVNFIIVDLRIIDGRAQFVIIAQFIYQSALGKYGLYCMQNGSYAVKYTDVTPLNRGDRFTVELDGTSLTIYRNGTSLISGTTKSYEDTLAYGFAVSSNHSSTYDKFMIRPSSSIVVPTVSSVGLTAASQSIYIDGSTSLSATVSMSDSSSASGKVVSFYDGDTLLGTGTCNSSGVATYTYSPTATGSRSIKAVCESVESSEVTVTVSKKAPSLSLETNNANVDIGGSYTLFGNLSFGGSALASATVKLYKSGGTLIDTLTTDSSGNYSKSFTGTETTTYYAVYNGTSTYTSVSSSNVTVTVKKPTPNLTVAVSKNNVKYGETYTISGTLTYGSTSLSGASVKLYRGQTLVDTLTTDSNGAISKTLTSSVIGTYSYRLRFDGDSDYSNVESSNVSVTVNSLSTELTLTTDSASVGVGDSFTLSGVLIDENATPLPNALIDIYEQTEGLIDTATTDSNGEFSLVVDSADWGMGSFIFYAQFDAPDGGPYYDSISENTTVSVKGIPTLSVSTSTSRVPIGETFQLSGRVTYEGSGLTNVRLYLFEDDDLIDEMIVDNTGTFVKYISAPMTEGSYVYKVKMEENSMYKAVENSVTITVSSTPEPDEIDLTSDKSILSYYDGESATLTATVYHWTHRPNPVEGVTVEFFKGDVSIGTAITNSSGVATKTYASAGAGDVSFTAAVGSLVSEICDVQDCRFYDVSSSENVSKYGSSSAFSYDSTEQAYYISTSSVKNITRDSVVGDFDFEISMDIKMTDNKCNFYCGESTSSYECQGHLIGTYSSNYKGMETYYTNSSQSVSGRTRFVGHSFDTNKWYTYKVTRNDNILTVQVLDGDTVIATAIDNNVTGTSNSVAWHLYIVQGNMYWKNIKFKPL